RAERGRSLAQESISDVLLDAPDPSDDRRVGLAEAQDRRGAKLGSAEQGEARATAEGRLRLGTNAPTRPPVAAERQEAVEAARSTDPQRHGAEDVQTRQQAELELDGDQRRKLEKARMADDLAEEDVPRCGEGESARLCDRRSCSAHVGLVELERGTELDDR